MSDSSDDAPSGRESLLPSLILSVLGGLPREEQTSPGLPPGQAAPTGQLRGHPPPCTGTDGPPPASATAAENKPPAAPARPTRAAPANRPRGAKRGDCIGGRYIVDGQIGRGGMGRVLRVRHQVLGKPFALKLIKLPISSDPRIREMFYGEARLASALSHDNICSILDFGEDPVFGLFMVMELLEGQTLYEKLRHDGRMNPKVACDVMFQIGDAVRFIHSRAIVHGDLKSENMLLTRSPHRRRLVKLLDFGLARPDAARRTGNVEGTPEYLAPERIAHRAAASQTSDIYALGILFYELLVGELPFRGSLEEIFKQQVTTPIPKVSEKIKDPNFDERADEIIARATAKDPADRHPDCAGFLYELRTLMTMLGMESGRKRPRLINPGEPRDRPQPEHRNRASLEVFDNAPLPLACVDPSGSVRVANRTFLEFLGVAGWVGGIQLADSGLREVYPTLMEDLVQVSQQRTPLKRIIYLSEGGGTMVEVAVILTPAPADAPVTAGEIHLALHPLGRIFGSANAETIKP